MLYKKLGERDIEIINSYLNRYGENPYSNVYCNREVDLSKRLAQWDAAKSEYLYRLLDDQFIVEKQVEYTDSVDLLMRKISNAMCSGGAMAPFYREYRKWVNSLDFDYFSSEITVLSRLSSSECIARENLGADKYLQNYLPITIDFGNGKKIKFENTTKPIRALGKLSKMFDIGLEDYEQFRLEHSRILNTKKITGTLCLSIHPMDYMTMSMNKEKWTSCMNWGEPGSYRGGTIEVMNSPMVVVAYLKSDTNEYEWEDGGSWNSKKWRLLMVVNHDAILSIKAYPYHHEELAQTAINYLKEFAAKNLNWYYGDTCVVPCEETFLYADTNTYYKVGLVEGRMMYCDWGCDVHYGCFNLNPDCEETSDTHPHVFWFDYCGPLTCMNCGEVDNGYYDESYVYCDRCCNYGEEEEYEYCERCGERIYEGDGIWLDDCCYCEHCIEEVAERCAIDDEWYYREELIPVYLAHEKDHPNTSVDECALINETYITGGRWNTTLPNRLFNCEHPNKTEDEIYYFNREDVLARGFNRVYDLWDSGIDAYFEEI